MVDKTPYQHEEIEKLFDNWNEDEEDTISVLGEINQTAEEMDDAQLELPTTINVDQKKSAKKCACTNDVYTGDFRRQNEEKDIGNKQSLCSPVQDSHLSVKAGKDLTEPDENKDKDIQSYECLTYMDQINDFSNNLRVTIKQHFEDLLGSRKLVKQYKLPQRSLLTTEERVKRYKQQQDNSKENPDAVITDLCEKFNVNSL